MSLVQGYSSDEDAVGHNDAFNLAALPSSKRFTIQDTPLNTTPHAAPHVLAQVGFFHSPHPFFVNANELTRIRSIKPLL
jgi:hypothetical protein